MLSIGAGAQQQVMPSSSKWAFTTFIVEAQERTISRAAKSTQVLSRLTFQDLRVIRANVLG